jgi:hypothetical protein
MTTLLLALDDHPMNRAMAAVIVIVTGLGVLFFLFYALYHVDDKARLTEPAVACAFVWVMLCIYLIGSIA